MTNKVYILLFALVLFSCPSIGQRTGIQSLSDLEESPAGSKILMFLNQVNSGEKITDENIKSLMTDRLIDKHGIEGLKEIYQNIRENDGQLELFDAERIEIFKYSLKLKSPLNGSWLDAEINFEPQSPYKIDGLRLDLSPVEAKNKKPIFGPEEKIKMSSEPKVFPPLEDIANATDEMLLQFVDLSWFSGVVLLAKNGNPFYHRAFGMADESIKMPNTIQTKFRIGSINKDYTDVLIMQMVENGKLNLDDKLSQFDLGFPTEMADKINLRQILLHRAGFSDIFIPEYMNNIRAYKDIDDILPLLMNKPLSYEPGTNQSYSNYGYIVLGAILEKVSGKTFEVLLQENILSVLDTRSTHYNIAEQIEGEAKSYRFDYSGQKIDHTPKLEYCTPDGGMYATAEDLLNFFQTYYYSERLLSDNSKAMRAFDYEEPKMSWNQIIQNPNAGMASAGGGPGVNAVVLLEFAENFCAIILANTDHGVAEQIERRISDIINSRTPKPAKLPPSHIIYQTLKKEGPSYVAENFTTILENNGYRENSPGLLNQMGYMLKRHGQLMEALEIFHLNAQIFADDANVWDSLSEAYYDSGELEKARKYAEKALGIDPGFLSSKERIEKLKQQ